MVNFEENYHLSRFQRGSNIFQGGGGSNCLIPIETHITCDFPGGAGSGPPVPTLDPHLHKWINSKLSGCTHQALDGLASNPALASVVWCATGVELTPDHFLIFINDLSDNRSGLLFLGSKYLISIYIFFCGGGGEEFGKTILYRV